MSKATGAKKPSESQQMKALWAMKAAKDSHRRTSTGEVSLSIRSHVVCVVNHRNFEKIYLGTARGATSTSVSVVLQEMSDRERDKHR